MSKRAALIIGHARYWIEFLAQPTTFPLPEEDLRGAALALENIAPVDEGWEEALLLAKALHAPMENRGYWGEWDDFLNSLLRQAEARADVAALVGLLIRQGIVQHLRGDLPAAISAYHRAWRCARQAGDRSGQAIALTNLADLYRRESCFWRAGVLCRCAATLFRQVGDLLRYAHTLNTLGMVYIDQRRYPEAAPHFEQAETTFAELADTFGLAKVRHNLGSLYTYTQQFPQALAALRFALDYYIAVENVFEAAQVQISLGYVLTLSRDFVQAEAVLSQAEKTFQELQHPHRLGQVLHNLGITYIRQWRWLEAQQCFARAVEIWRKQQDTWNLANTLSEFAGLYCAWGRWDVAVTCQREAEVLVAALPTPGVYPLLRAELAERHKLLYWITQTEGEPMSTQALLETVAEILAGVQSRDDKLQALCALLEHVVPHYDWVGFYLVAPDNERELVLGPYVGDPTDHQRIAFGQGICGQAAATEQTFIIQDVSQETNYLSCSPQVKSEIVIPILKAGRVVGELDIDSHALAPFTEADRRLLEDIAGCVAELF